jgi:hypothetical protein
VEIVSGALALDEGPAFAVPVRECEVHCGLAANAFARHGAVAAD